VYSKCDGTVISISLRSQFVVEGVINFTATHESMLMQLLEAFPADHGDSECSLNEHIILIVYEDIKKISGL